MAEVVRYIDTDVSGGAGDGTSWADAYSSMNAWEAAEQADLVTAGDWHHAYCRASSGTADTIQVIIGDWITGENNYLEVEAGTDNEALKSGWNTGRYRLSVANDSALGINEDHFRIDKMQIEVTEIDANYESPVIINIVSAANEIRISNSRLRGNNDAGSRNRALHCADGDLVLKTWNTIYEECGGAAGSDCVYLVCTTANFYNCILRKATQDGIDVDGGTVNMYNCAVFDTADDFDGTNTVDHCASDDGDGTNPVSPSGGDWDNEFNDPSNGDFTLLNSGNLYHGGADDPGSGLYSKDIEGDDYYSGAFSIGVDEYVAGGAYTLDAAVGSFTLSGQIATLLATRKLFGAAGAFTLSGQSADLLGGRLLSAGAGAFSLSGQDAGLRTARLLSGQAGAFALSGQVADLLSARMLSGEAGAFSLSGQAAGLYRGLLLPAGAGAFVLTGQAADLIYSANETTYTLIADVGVFALSGQDVDLLRSYLLEIEPGVFVLTGLPAMLTYSGELQQREILTWAAESAKVLSFEAISSKSISEQAHSTKVIEFDAE